MRNIQTEILVIGGGATGTGVVRDLAMRGFNSVLVERSDLATGTTGRYHGLLHSGGRYAVKDPQAARECIEENRILRRIMPQCIEDTGGFFVVTPWDSPEYAPMFVQGCRNAGIPLEEVPVGQMMREEPLLNPKITHCYRVPDAAADSWLAADLNAKSAREYGAAILRYHKTIKLLREGDRVVGAVCLDIARDEEVTIHADFVVNTSGAWAGQITGSIGVPVHIVPGKGVMLAANHRILNTVVNRCKMPSDGDILVPIHTVTVIGTTDVHVSDPDRFAIEPWEVRLMLEEGDKLVPGFKDMRMLRAWAGVRPLYQESQIKDTRDITRAFVLLDHEQRDGVAGLVTITSGKWTTYRKMAEVTADLVCSKLGQEHPCRTHLEALPADNHKPGYHIMGSRFAAVEKVSDYGRLVCECELATIDDVTGAIQQGEANTIDDVRRDIRLGMGPCQGGFCTYRVTGLLHRLRRPGVEQSNVALRDFLQERWKGLLPILWGQQLRQERLNELIYLSLLNAEVLPGPAQSRLGAELYVPPESGEHQLDAPARHGYIQHISAGTVLPSKGFSASALGVDMLIIGAGLAGLTAAWQAAIRGARVRVISKGWGTLFWHAGCIDVWNPESAADTTTADAQARSLAEMMEKYPDHPYSKTGMGMLEQAVNEFKSLSERAGYPLRGSLEDGWIFPTGLGTARYTCLAPETMLAGDLRNPGAMAVVGFEQFLDFYPQLVADNLRSMGVQAEAIMLDLDHLNGRTSVTPKSLAALFEQPEFRERVVRVLMKILDKNRTARIGFPAVLGLNRAVEVVRDLEEMTGLLVFEIPTLPPSIPGIRLHNMLVAEIERHGGRVLDGMDVMSAEYEGDMVRGVWSEAAARPKLNRASSYILATGGILGGGVQMGVDGRMRECVFDLPLAGYSEEGIPFRRSFLGSGGHPVFRAGVNVNGDLQPISPNGERFYRNLYTVGSALAYSDPVHERSVEGVALVTGFAAGARGGVR